MATTFETESNDTKATANAGSLGTAIGGQLLSSSDVDFFKFTVTSSTILNLSFASPTNFDSSYFNISIYDSVNATTPIYTNLTGASFDTLKWSATPGTYYISVTSALFYNSGQYSLTVKSGTFNGAIAEKEANDTYLTANSALMGRDVFGQLSSLSDKDFYSFVVAQTGQYSLTFDASTISGGDLFRISVYDTNGDLFASQQTSPDITAYNFTAATAGTYYVSVEAEGFLDTHSYHLTVNKSGSSSTILNGGDIDDYLLGTAGVDAIFGKAGNDVLLGKDGDDLLDGGTGVDTMMGGAGDDSYYVDSAKDVIVENSSSGLDTVIASLNVTSLVSNVENLTLTGAAVSGTGNSLGNDIKGNALNNKLNGAAGNDMLDGSTGNDTLTGGTGNDIFIVDSQKDVVVEAANGGNDTIQTKVDLLTTAANIENIELLEGVIYVNGSSTANKITGNDGHNNLNGLGGNDSLDGGAGPDALNGGTGNDTLTGGSEADAFVFNTALSTANNADIITDFIVGEDQILLSHAVFTKFVIGDLEASYFVQGAAPVASSSHAAILYQTSGDLYYDSDGTGAAASIKFAHLDGVASLSASDFVIT
jgi:Ca2+-binding RTX toxin-like protein